MRMDMAYQQVHEAPQAPSPARRIGAERLYMQWVVKHGVGQHSDRSHALLARDEFCDFDGQGDVCLVWR